MKSFWNSACDINPVMLNPTWWGDERVVDNKQFEIALSCTKNPGEMHSALISAEESFMFLLFLSYEFDEENV